ncbi:MAG: hypothetical protein GX640_12015 [Fibrobacter sp.]|nr:hypothetical protein [Fibrobacter sp.]
MAVPGTFKLLPSAELLKELADDYKRMNVMIFGTPPSFDSIIETLSTLEREINTV